MGSEDRFYKRPMFGFFVRLGALIGLLIYTIIRIESVPIRILFITLDIAVILISLVVWLAFFAQFILPVRRFFDRSRIFLRLFGYMFGVNGAEIFVEDGTVRESHEEREKSGPGVIWLDSASGGVIRNDVRFVRAIGPGVHFTSYRERLAGTVDLHVQMQKIGPKDEDLIFEKKTGEMSDAEYEDAQKRRRLTSGLTRDGIEVVPGITVLFKIAADPVRDPNSPGSRFGYDADAVFRAVVGRGVNAAERPDAPQRQVEWNQLPAVLAADLWREYLSRFTLNQLFEASQPPPPPPPPVPGLGDGAVAALHEPVSPPRNNFERDLAALLSEVNKLLSRLLKACQPKAAEASPAPGGPAGTAPDEPGQHQTALEVINQMIKDRLQKPEVDELDEFGRRTGRRIPSPEYELIRGRGLKVISASAANLRFTQSVEDQLVRQWIATWLENARIERERLDRRRSLIELNGRERTFREYAGALSRELIQNRGQLNSARQTAQTLLARTRRELVRNDRLHRRLSTELDELNEALRWLGRDEEGQP